MTTFASQPPRALLQGENTDAEKRRWEKLEADGDLPLTRGIVFHKENAVVNPVGGKNPLSRHALALAVP